MDAPAVRLLGICKRFGAVLANDDVSLSVASGSVHGIVGENGAGKSTLMSVLYGLYRAESGTVEVFGQVADISHPRQAIALGIGMVHQHFLLVDRLSALDNVMLGAEPHVLLKRSEAIVRQGLDALMRSTGLHLALDSKVEDLPVGDRQRLEILKALYRGAKILILDEPTAVLTPLETEQLFAVLTRLARQGTTILLITHKLKEVMRLCDRVTVMRGGRVVHETAVAQTSVEDLALAMVGRKVRLGREARAHDDARALRAGGVAPLRANDEVLPRGSGELLLQVQGIVLRDALRVTRLHGLDIELRSGEIVGLAGVSGNGQSELIDVLAGLREPDAGRLMLGGESFTPGAWLDPRAARRLKLAHVPEDRQQRALVMSFAAWESGVLGHEALPEYCHHGWMRHAAMRDATRAMMQRFDVRPPDPELGSAAFSGGNQQKLVLARELSQAPRVLLVGQPTRGVDIGAIEFIHSQMRALRDAGCALLLLSSELDEILALADRVLVMHQGRISGELDIDDCSEARLGLLMAGGT